MSEALDTWAMGAGMSLQETTLGPAASRDRPAWPLVEALTIHVAASTLLLLIPVQLASWLIVERWFIRAIGLAVATTLLLALAGLLFAWWRAGRLEFRPKARWLFAFLGIVVINGLAALFSAGALVGAPVLLLWLLYREMLLSAPGRRRFTLKADLKRWCVLVPLAAAIVVGPAAGWIDASHERWRVEDALADHYWNAVGPSSEGWSKYPNDVRCSSAGADYKSAEVFTCAIRFPAGILESEHGEWACAALVEGELVMVSPSSVNGSVAARELRLACAGGPRHGH